MEVDNIEDRHSRLGHTDVDKLRRRNVEQVMNNAMKWM
jgi:hypothetical protein